MFSNLQADILTLDGDTNVAANIDNYIKDTYGNILFCVGTVAAPATGAGYAKGCIYIKADVGAGTGAMYLNKGTTLAANFTLVTQA
jgi:hypothetical protein